MSNSNHTPRQLSRKPMERREPFFRSRDLVKYVRSIVYGGTDGIVSIFGLVAGCYGADVASGLILILGFSNLFADAISMGVSDFLSQTSETESKQRELDKNYKAYDQFPQMYKDKLNAIFKRRGFHAEEAEKLSQIISKNATTTVDIVMMEEELTEEPPSPTKSAFYTFMAFIFFGFIPLLADVTMYVGLGASFRGFFSACFLTGCTLVALGVARAKITQERIIDSAIEMVSIGGFAAVVAYCIGYFMSVERAK